MRGVRAAGLGHAGRALHGSHLPLRTWFLAAWLVATHRNGMSARQLWRQLGLGSYKSAWRLLRTVPTEPTIIIMSWSWMPPQFVLRSIVRARITWS